MQTIEHDVIDPATRSSRDIYRLMTDLVAPRPIAWISSLDEQGRGNLAPFSYFQAVCSKPPTVVVAFGWKADGSPKDTLRNILATRDFTVSHVSAPLAEAMNASSVELPTGESEWMRVGPGGGPLPSHPATSVRPPRVAAALASLECTMTHAIPLGTGKAGGPSSTLVVARVLRFTVARGFLATHPRGHLTPIDPARLAAVGRMGGIAYTECSETFDLPRPPAPP